MATSPSSRESDADPIGVLCKHLPAGAQNAFFKEFGIQYHDWLRTWAAKRTENLGGEDFPFPRKLVMAPEEWRVYGRFPDGYCAAMEGTLEIRRNTRLDLLNVIPGNGPDLKVMGCNLVVEGDVHIAGKVKMYGSAMLYVGGIFTAKGVEWITADEWEAEKAAVRARKRDMELAAIDRAQADHVQKAPCHDSERYITFTKPWGMKSWLVDYTGTYNNSRPPHVELRRDVNSVGTLYDTMLPGSTYSLSNLRKIGKAVMWDVDGLTLDDGENAHFTVHFGNRRVEDFCIRFTRFQSSEGAVNTVMAGRVEDWLAELLEPSALRNFGEHLNSPRPVTIEQAITYPEGVLNRVSLPGPSVPGSWTVGGLYFTSPGSIGQRRVPPKSPIGQRRVPPRRVLLDHPELMKQDNVNYLPNWRGDDGAFSPSNSIARAVPTGHGFFELKQFAVDEPEVRRQIGHLFSDDLTAPDPPLERLSKLLSQAELDGKKSAMGTVPATTWSIYPHPQPGDANWGRSIVGGPATLKHDDPNYRVLIHNQYGSYPLFYAEPSRYDQLHFKEGSAYHAAALRLRALKRWRIAGRIVMVLLSLFERARERANAPGGMGYEAAMADFEEKSGIARARELP